MYSTDTTYKIINLELNNITVILPYLVSSLYNTAEKTEFPI